MTDDPRIDPADLRNVRFPGSSRRYDARSVDQFLETVAARIAATNVYVDELHQQLAAAGDAPAAPAPAAPPSDLSLLDDDALVRLIGEETASVLSTARRAADDIRSKAEEATARMIREATAEADRVTEEARTRAAELTAEASEVHAQATATAEEAAARIREEAIAEAEQLAAASEAAAQEQQSALDARREAAEVEAAEIVEAAREEGRAMVAEAREVRSRILDDLQRRRDLARAQVERLLEGRERLLAAYAAVRENLDDITGELADALPIPPEPDLPDGFVGAVGSAEPEQDADDAPEAGASAGDEPDGASEDAGEGEAASGSGDESVGSPPTGGVDEEIDDTRAPAAPEDPVADATEPEPAHEEPAAAPVDADEPVEQQPDAEAEDAPGDDEPVEVAGAAAPAGDVDALFARLRAEREQSVARAQEVLAADGSLDAPAEPVTDEARQEPPVAEQPPEPAAGDVDRVPAEFLAGEELLVRRAEALGKPGSALNRALKRRLADEQNELLDLLRRTGSIDPDDLLPDGEAQVEAYARLASKHLATAAAAGAGEAGADTAADVEELASALGRALVEPFRRRVERAAGDVDDADELDERLRALYREWKVQHVGPVVEDALLSAYGVGTRRSAGAGASLRWLIDPTQGPCPDAQDNALAGAVPAGEVFPTGDACPQAHPGCRCVLVVTD
jgi:DivIVA domain-containing protein